MSDVLAFAFEQPAMIVVPALGFALSLWLARIKTRYVKEGVIFRRASEIQLAPPTPADDATMARRAELPISAEHDPKSGIGWMIFTLAIDGLIVRYGGNTRWQSDKDLHALAKRAGIAWCALSAEIHNMDVDNGVKYQLAALDGIASDMASGRGLPLLFIYVQSLKILRKQLTGKDFPIAP